MHRHAAHGFPRYFTCKTNLLAKLPVHAKDESVLNNICCNVLVLNVRYNAASSLRMQGTKSYTTHQIKLQAFASCSIYFMSCMFSGMLNNLGPQVASAYWQNKQ